MTDTGTSSTSISTRPGHASSNRTPSMVVKMSILRGDTPIFFRARLDDGVLHVPNELYK